LDCVFCKIINGDIDSYKIYESEHCLAFLDKFPNNIGHSLIVTKKHIKNIFELDDESAEEILKIAKRISLALQAALNPDGINLVQNNNEAANQTIDHFHMHVIPRYFGDTIEFKWINKSFDESTFLFVLDKIKQAF
jgi:histidine triad (HIT) family protein